MAIRSSEIDRWVGARVKAARQAAGMPLGELAQRLGLAPKEMTACEAGRCRIGARRLHDVARELGRPFTYFFEGLEERQAEPDAFRHTILRLIMAAGKNDGGEEPRRPGEGPERVVAEQAQHRDVPGGPAQGSEPET